MLYIPPRCIFHASLEESVDLFGDSLYILVQLLGGEERPLCGFTGGITYRARCSAYLVLLVEDSSCSEVTHES
jgi:hypothetical protein